MGRFSGVRFSRLHILKPESQVSSMNDSWKLVWAAWSRHELVFVRAKSLQFRPNFKANMTVCHPVCNFLTRNLTLMNKRKSQCLTLLEPGGPTLPLWGVAHKLYTLNRSCKGRAEDGPKESMDHLHCVHMEPGNHGTKKSPRVENN